jgi:hypothetical protein
MRAANDNIQPRGLRRASAAAYLGISPSHFDTQRKAGAIPEPKLMFGVWLWDRVQLDALFDGDSPAAENDNISGSKAWELHWLDSANLDT